MISALKKLALISATILLPTHPAAAGTSEPAGPALWKVADEDTTIYLFGTIHVLPKDVEWFDGAIKQAFDASGELVTEVDMLAAGGPQQGAPPQALLPEGQTLRSLMGEEDRVEYEAALATLELPPGALDRFDPWFAGINLGMLTVVRKGYNPNAGADMALTKLAQEQGKDRAGLETAEFQLDMFDSTPIDLQLFYLDRTVEQLPRASDTIDTMLADWLAGNTEALAAVMNAGFEDPAAYEWLITRRNRNWAGWIDQRLDQPGVVFVAVGAGHLAGLGSVQEQLDELGIEVERVQ